MGYQRRVHGVVFPFFFLMGFLMFLGSLLSISRSSWFGVWGGLELNMMCFLPVVLHFSSFLSVESVVKYFLIQSFGRVGILLSGLYQDSFIFSSFSFIFFFCIVVFFLKLVRFPYTGESRGFLVGLAGLGFLFFLPLVGLVIYFCWWLCSLLSLAGLWALARQAFVIFWLILLLVIVVGF